MSNLPIPEEPKFIKNVEALQKIFAGIAFTMFVMVWVTGWNIVIDVFKPDFVFVLTILRVTIITIAISLSCFVGYTQGRRMIGWAIESWQLYQDALAMKKKGKE